MKQILSKFLSALLGALFALVAVTASAESPVAQWQDTQPSLPQALASTNPADYTEDQYGCHAYLVKTASNTYNLAFTTKKGVVEDDVDVKTVVSQDCEQLTAVNNFTNSLSANARYTFALDNTINLTGTTSEVGSTYAHNPLAYRTVTFTSNDLNINGQPMVTSSLDEGPYNEDWMLFSNVSVTPNTAPTLSFIAPDGDTTINSSYTIEWIASDPDNQAVISLYYDTDNSGNNGTLIVNTLVEGTDNSYLWDTSGIEGTYYLYAKIDDEVNPAVYHYADHELTIDTVPPQLTMPTDLSVTVASVPTALDIGQATATDLSTPVTITDNAPAQFNVGTTMVAWTAVDNNGNSVTKSQSIVVELESQASPTLSLPAVSQGEQAVQALLDANKLAEVAASYGMTSEEFSDMLRNEIAHESTKKDDCFIKYLSMRKREWMKSSHHLPLLLSLSNKPFCYIATLDQIE